MEAAFNDLQILCSFDYCSVPSNVEFNHLATESFAPLLASPWNSIIKWIDLRSALISYFDSSEGIKPELICGGWNGLPIIVACFKRLEAAIEDQELVAIEEWINSILRATLEQT